MDSSTPMLFLQHGFDPRQHLENYLSDKSEFVFGDEFLLFPIKKLTKIFKLGHIKADILIDLSLGSMIHHLYAACEFFTHMILLKVKDRCILELKRWVDTRTGAFDWCHAAKLHAVIEGKSDQVEEKESKVRSALQHVIKCDLEKENITEPIDLPPADCIISAWLLDVTSKDKNDYIRYLRKFSKLLKPGGHLILIGDIEASYFIVGKHKFHILKYDEDFVRNALAGEGFTVDYCEVKNRRSKSELIDHKAVLFIAAQKNK
ncbi:hypothetical protein GDO81_019008 [Engystomops pustulosus]|uniref:Nicotinamide N-methyltransferase n=1 Tax=Engystomops pustulosus TaxID=76066 RepID=A0AAV6ZB17_ENGPU|nr:hypothetical protein GDO81_019008 [Engystomops pustulosus]